MTIASYRVAEAADGPALSALVKRSLTAETLPGWTPAAICSLLANASPEGMREQIVEAAFAHVACTGAHVVGFILAKRSGSLGLLVVEPSLQRLGIGSQLVACMLHQLDEAASDVSVVEVNATEHSLPFYRRLGFYPLSEFIEFDGCRFMRLGHWRKNPVSGSRRSTMSIAVGDEQAKERNMHALTDAMSPAALAAALTEYWSPRVIAELDDSYVKVAKVRGSLAWHRHDDEDELFYILEGSLRIEMEDRTVLLRRGEFFVVPKGVRHHPIADEECHIMLIERKSTLHTGSEITDKTRTLAEQLRPL